jgi:hypothetical protein
MDEITNNIKRLLPKGVSVVKGDQLRWSPKTKTITYCSDNESNENIWGLFHEASHAMLGHTTFNSDIELMLLEVAAWQKAEELGLQLGKPVDAEHIQDCLDTYRDWLHERSTCPRCGIVCFQEVQSRYKCHNCHKTWSVSASRLCRPYRLGTEQNKNRPEITPQAVFQEKVT